MIDCSADKSKDAFCDSQERYWILHVLCIIESFLSQCRGQQHHFGARRHSSYVVKECVYVTSPVDPEWSSIPQNSLWHDKRATHLFGFNGNRGNRTQQEGCPRFQHGLKCSLKEKMKHMSHELIEMLIVCHIFTVHMGRMYKWKHLRHSLCK